MLGRKRTPPAPAGPAIEGYADFRLIGAGGFSKVYTARQEAFGRTVAVKVITVELDDAARRRFARERTLTAQLDGHPHVVRVYDTGETDRGEPYLAMEHHEQGSMADRLRRHGPLPLADVLRTGVLLAGALDAAHRRGIVHRDVKPQNVLVSSFVGPVLADFGIAHVADARLTTVGHEAFSVLHAAPEVLAGEPATPASDLYSLASTLYELTEGRAPFADDERPGLLALLHRAQHDPLPPLTRLDVPPEVERGLAALLAREPARRPADAVTFARALQALEMAAGLPPTPLVAPTSGPGPERGPAAPTPAPPSPQASTPPQVTPPSPLSTLDLGRRAGPARPAGPPPAPDPPVPVGYAPPAPVGYAAPAPGPAEQGHTVALGGRLHDHQPGVPDGVAGPGDGRARRRGLLAAGSGLAVLIAATSAAIVVNRSGGGPGPTTTADPNPATTTPTTLAAGGLPACPPGPGGGIPSRPFAKGEPPTDLAAEALADGRSATVTWSDPNAGANVYVVFVRCDAGEGRPPIGAVRMVGVGEKPSVTIDGLDVSVNYCFTVGVLEPTGGTQLFTDPNDRTQFRCLDGTRV